MEVSTIDWERLLEEFKGFEPDEEIRKVEPDLFVRSLVEPVPGFVAAFIEKKAGNRSTRSENVRALYSFLLEKRYEERLNLLHFAFNIFDDETCLPEEIIDRTPFPHEDGIPRFRSFVERRRRF